MPGSENRVNDELDRLVARWQLIFGAVDLWFLATGVGYIVAGRTAKAILAMSVFIGLAMIVLLVPGVQRRSGKNEE